ncbi:hypothetical protein [Hymenobacter sp. BRD67]|uniref:hypothetical protein n=1 Tax=Hymenobacter sp. BRD67 TaxID=2675877 RepID=UPI0015651A4F|nr:hypothetical protein [Hymenobacter sp. BRD67]QKG52853.1 hypothetical protein GKZ67_09865 [Hymenobacter sp. BRD67]QKG52855.1 hypothetical protein GKZ67_09875 [Hymenobacter sp. BRD67]
MIFFFTSHITEKTRAFSSIVWEIGQLAQSVAASKQYFSINLDIYVGLICEGPPFEGFYKYRRPRLSRIKDASGNVVSYQFTYEFIIPYASIGEQDIVQLTKRYFLDNLLFLDKIKAFNTKTLKDDLTAAVSSYNRPSIYI